MQVCVAPSMYSIDEKSVNIEMIFFFSLSCFIYDSKFWFTFIYLKLQTIKVTPTFSSFEKKIIQFLKMPYLFYCFTILCYEKKTKRNLTWILNLPNIKWKMNFAIYLDPNLFKTNAFYIFQHKETRFFYKSINNIWSNNTRYCSEFITNNTELRIS